MNSCKFNWCLKSAAVFTDPFLNLTQYNFELKPCLLIFISTDDMLITFMITKHYFKIFS